MSPPVASTSKAGVKAQSPSDDQPMEPNEDRVNLSDLFSGEDLVDRLVGAVSNNDVAACLFYIRQLEMRKNLDLVNLPRESSSVSSTADDSTAALTRYMTCLTLSIDQTRRRTRPRSWPPRSRNRAAPLKSSLASSPARGPSCHRPTARPTGSQTYRLGLSSWSRRRSSPSRKRVSTSSRRIGTPSPADRLLPSRDTERETQMLLTLDYDAAQEWCRNNLPPPEQSDEGMEDYGGYTSEDLGNGRASSVPLDDIAAYRRQIQRATTADAPGPVELERAPNGTGDSSAAMSARAAGKRAARSQVQGTVLDLTGSRTPSPAPKNEEVEVTVPNGRPPSPSGRKRPRSRSPPPQPGQGRDQRPLEARAHLHVANLPLDFTSADLATVFDGVPGVPEVEMYGANTDSPFGYVSLASLATAQHAYALKHNTLPRIGAITTIELKIYSADGTPLDPHRQVEPVVNNLHGGGPGGGGAAAPREAPHVFNNYRGPMQGAMPLRYPRPRVPFHFTAAELARRVYLGCLRWGITDAEVASLFHERAGVVAKVLRVMNAHDGSHAFGCVLFSLPA